MRPGTAPNVPELDRIGALRRAGRLWHTPTVSTKARKHLAKRRRQNRRRSAETSRPLGRRLRRLALRAGLIAALLPFALALPFRWIDPPTSSIILQRGAQALLDGREAPRFGWRDARQISHHLPVAVISSEDQKFPHHFGFDVDSIVDAATEDTKRRRGASTISQQVAKNLFLWPGRSWLRKALEAYFTVALETLWPKARILEIYLNIAEFGPDVFGAEAGSRYHFGKPASRLSVRESALLAAVLPNPARLSASQPSDYVRDRADKIASMSAGLGGPAILRGL